MGSPYGWEWPAPPDRTGHRWARRTGGSGQQPPDRTGHRWARRPGSRVGGNRARASVQVGTVRGATVSGSEQVASRLRGHVLALERVDHRVGGADQVGPQLVAGRLVHLDRPHCVVHALQPVVPLRGGHLERFVSHPQPRVPALLGVGAGPAPVLFEEHPQPVLGRAEVLLRIHRVQVRGLPDVLVEPVHDRPEGLRPAHPLVRGGLVGGLGAGGVLTHGGPFRSRRGGAGAGGRSAAVVRGRSAAIGDVAEADGQTHRVGQVPARVRIVARQRHRVGRVDPVACRWIDQAQVRRFTGGDRAALVGQGEQRRGSVRHPIGDTGPVEQSGPDQRLDHHREGLLQADHARARIDEGMVLVLRSVRGVVGADHVDRAVGDRGPQRLDVLGGAQRWVDLEGGVVAGHQICGQQQMVRGGLGRHPDTAGLGGADDVQRLPGRHVADVVAGPGEGGELHVAGDDRRLGGRRPAAQPELAGELALVAAGVRAGQPRVLGVLGEHAVEGPDVLERPAHHLGVRDALPIVGEAPGAGGPVDQPQLGELLTGQPLGDRAARDDDAGALIGRDRGDLPGDVGGVGDRGGVRHRLDRGETAAGGRRGAGADRLGILAPGLTQVDVRVDQAGQRDQSGAVEPLDARGHGRGVPEDRAVHVHITRRAVGEGDAGDQQPGRAAGAERGDGHAVGPFLSASADVVVGPSGAVEPPPSRW
ncbi:hypothetical protein SDC9_63907 [bioreactor metagenome]|uniref:Uncharacterized protein n=1 Tax=bioreactor metagenome TaxID=1076179 RepID=A0A644XMU7_9ZZZZ